MATNRVPPLNLAIASDYAIFLDCRADLYFALSPAENDAVLALLDGGTVSDRMRRALTSALGVEIDAQRLRSLQPPPLPLSRQRRGGRPARAPWAGRAAALRHLFVTALTLRRRGLYATLEQLAGLEPRPQTSAPRDDLIGRVTDAHDWLSRHATAHDACLLRSIALARDIRSRGAEAMLVIGVKADPFAAHCWVQSAGLLLNEEPDAIAPFSPIMVVA